MNSPKTIKFEVEVIQTVEVELDLDKFTQKVRDNFEATIHKAPELEDHAQFIGTRVAMGYITGWNEFVEGYGKLQEVGVKFSDPEQHSNVWCKMSATGFPPGVRKLKSPLPEGYGSCDEE